MATSIPVTTQINASIAYASNAISNHLRDLEERIQRAKGFEAEQALAIEFLSAHAHLQPEPTRDGEYVPEVFRVHLSLDPGTVNALMINYDATQLSDVTEPLRWLAQRLGKYEIEDYPELGRRSYIFANDGRALRFQVFFNSDKSVCRFVQTGVKEEPVFKLMCEGAEVTQ